MLIAGEPSSSDAPTTSYAVDSPSADAGAFCVFGGVHWTRARLFHLFGVLAIALVASSACAIVFAMRAGPGANAALSPPPPPPPAPQVQPLAQTECYNCKPPFPIEQIYCNQHQFGPTASQGWDFRKMTVVAPYTLQIGPLSVNADLQVLMVSKLMCASYPPLGETWWKQSKIGFGALLSQASSAASVNFTFAAIPGGGTGRYPGSGAVTLTLFTPGHPTRPSQVDFSFAAAGFIARDAVLPFNSTLTDSRTATVVVYSAAAFDSTLIALTNADIVSTAATLVPAGMLQTAATQVVVRARTTATPATTAVVPVTISYRASLPLTIIVSGATSVSEAGSVGRNGTWSPLRTVRDASGMLSGAVAQLRSGAAIGVSPQPLPAGLVSPTLVGVTDTGGWYVTPVHFNWVPALGRMLVTGWLRRDGLPCFGDAVGPGGRRRAGVSFLLDPAALDAAAGGGELSIGATRIEENAVYPSEVYRSPPALMASGSAMYSVDGDALYCAGHAPMRDGRIFFFGGGRYADISSAFEREWGLDYARIFDPATRSFIRVPTPAPLGRAWYPTVALLPDGRLLIAGGFSDYGTDTCVGTVCTNSQLNTFDPATMTWTVLVDKSAADEAIAPGIREYTRIIVLPRPVVAGGRARHVLLMGKAGRVVLLSTDPSASVPMRDRLFRPANGARPLPTDVNPMYCADRSDQSTAVVLTHTAGGAGEVAVIGGGCGSSQQRADIYNVQTDVWRSIDLGIYRQVPSASLLPDGRVLIANGENGGIDQAAFASTDAGADPRFVQIIDADASTVQTESARSAVFRGYHNVLALLPSGALVTGGGFNQWGDVGCEEPNLNVFSPSYLAAGPRPSIVNASIGASGAPFRLVAGQRDATLVVDATVALHPTRGVVLQSVPAFTHSYDQNQRHVRALNIRVTSIGGTSSALVTFDVPASPIIIPGVHYLFLVSSAGVPSVARFAVVGSM